MNIVVKIAVKMRVHLSVLNVAVVAAISTTSLTATATTSSKKTAGSSATKTIYVKDLNSSFKGRAKASVPVDNRDIGHAPVGYSVTMKSKNKTAASKAASLASAKKKARTMASTSAKPAFANEPPANFARILKASQSANGPELALGQALAVNDSYLVTSADFVNEAWTNSGEVKFFVADTPQALQLVAFDLGSNLAIFSVGLTARMDHTLPMSRMRTDEMSGQEDYSSLGGSGAVASLVSGAHRLKPVADLTFVRERFEMPAAVAVGVSNGVQFLFDRSGRWTGSVSLLDQREGRKFDVSSANQVHEILAKLEQRPPAPLPPTVVREQAQAWQNRWTAKFFEAGGALKGLECAAQGVRTDDARLTNEIVRTRLVHCNNAIPVALSRDYSMGVDIVTGDVSYSKGVTSYLAADQSATTVFAPLAKRGPASINVMSGAECEKSEVNNSHGKRVHVRFCTAALKNAPGLTDTTITTLSADSGQKSSMHSLHLRGFDAKNTKRFMEWMIETETIQ